MKHINRIIRVCKSAEYRTLIRRGFLSKGLIDLRHPRRLTKFQKVAAIALLYTEKQHIQAANRRISFMLNQLKDRKKTARRKRKVSKISNYYRR